ncbi:hypothetical protein BS47DRAFT_1387319 [Hydnum rufescens UP504]|uniref:DASH complex subunit DUO1 n=1 Tax=Hydnum rufescens UP504 TaxID=1448309 RepID=A0A9P6BCL8_9AGAM|nr:hypothetical protein BS47DRAFT_1387319 [Hydnum rufescens UP504]
MHPSDVSYDLLNGEAPEFDTTSLTGDVEATPIPKTRLKGKEKERGIDTEEPLRISTLGSAPLPLTEEERLRRQLFDMQKINAAFGAYYDALTAVQDRQQTLATKVNQTKQLLDRYVAILGQAEHNARLLLDPNWQGAEVVRTRMPIFRMHSSTSPAPGQDAARLAEIRRREEESLRLEREAVQRKEEEARARREAEERLEAEKMHAAGARIRGGVRGSARARGGAATRFPTMPFHLSQIIAPIGALPLAGRGSRVSAPAPTRTPSVPRPPSSTTMRAPSSGGGSTGSAGKTRGSAHISGIKPPTAGRGVTRGVGRGKPTAT